jgi:hypothetical protein
MQIYRFFAGLEEPEVDCPFLAGIGLFSTSAQGGSAMRLALPNPRFSDLIS